MADGFRLGNLSSQSIVFLPVGLLVEAYWSKDALVLFFLSRCFMFILRHLYGLCRYTEMGFGSPSNLAQSAQAIPGVCLSQQSSSICTDNPGVCLSDREHLRGGPALT